MNQMRYNGSGTFQGPKINPPIINHPILGPPNRNLCVKCIGSVHLGKNDPGNSVTLYQLSLSQFQIFQDATLNYNS